MHIEGPSVLRTLRQRHLTGLPTTEREATKVNLEAPLVVVVESILGSWVEDIIITE